MEITCSQNPDKRSVFTVYWDGLPWRDLHTSIFGRKPMIPKASEEFKEHFAAYEYQQVKKYVLKRLSIQPMLSTALSRALKVRLIGEPLIQTIVQECIELGFLNDAEWTASFVRSQSNRKNGPRAIAQKLASKGVRGVQLEEAMDGAWDTEKQKDLITALLRSRYAKRNLSDYKERQKAIASLVRKGFDLSVIMALINRTQDIQDIQDFHDIHDKCRYDNKGVLS